MRNRWQSSQIALTVSQSGTSFSSKRPLSIQFLAPDTIPCFPVGVLRPIHAALLCGHELYREVVLHRMAQARESVWIATANVKAMFVERSSGEFKSVLDLFADLARRGVELRLLHAELPSRPFRAAFERQRALWTAMQLKICPRVHFKTVLVDGAWIYL